MMSLCSLELKRPLPITIMDFATVRPNLTLQAGPKVKIQAFQSVSRLQRVESKNVLHHRTSESTSIVSFLLRHGPNDF